MNETDIENKINDIETEINGIKNSLNDIKLKISMPNGIMQIKNARFYLPNFPSDCIQRCMAQMQDYWDRIALNIINKYLPENAVILDIGANIGSHTVYWALERNAKKIYSFEPLDATYEILERNVELNKLQNCVETYNVGLYSTECKAKVAQYNIINIGNTSFTPEKNGKFVLKTLDSFDFKDKIDLIKIDVEGAEVEVLQGGIKTLRKYKPVLVIESFNRKVEVDKFLSDLDYVQVDTIRQGEDYIYKAR